MDEVTGLNAQRFWLDAEGKVQHEPRDEAAVEWLRKELFALTPPLEVDFRSCWQCNSAHEHFLNRHDYGVRCFDCGRIYFRGIDLMGYTESK